MRYVPHLRNSDNAQCGLETLKKLEIHFIKEEFTRGYQVLKQGQKDDYLYFIFKGKCRLLLSTRSP